MSPYAQPSSNCRPSEDWSAEFKAYYTGLLAARAARTREIIERGVDSSLYVMEVAPHGAHVATVDTPEARDANAYIARWFNEHLAR